MEEREYQPLLIAQFFDETSTLFWPWTDEFHARFAMLGAHQKPKRDMVRMIAEAVHQEDAHAVFWITPYEQVSSEGEPFIPENLVDFEVDPAAGEDELPNQATYLAQRSWLAQHYFELLAIKRGMTRTDLLPPASFRKHLEGPLIGYLRAIQEVEDEELRSWLESKCLELGSISFQQSEQAGSVYQLPLEGEVIDQAIALYQAVWSLWAFLASRREPQQYLFIVEVPPSLLSDENENIRAIVVELLRILNYLTEVTTTALLLSTESLYPAVQQNFRHKLYFNHLSDCQVEAEGNLAYFTPFVVQHWQQGHDDVFLWADEAEGQRYVCKTLQSEQ